MIQKYITSPKKLAKRRKGIIQIPKNEKIPSMEKISCNMIFIAFLFYKCYIDEIN